MIVMGRGDLVDRVVNYAEGLTPNNDIRLEDPGFAFDRMICWKRKLWLHRPGFGAAPLQYDPNAKSHWQKMIEGERGKRR